MSNKYPWDHDYTMRLSVGLVGAEREDTVNPAVDSSYSEEEWNAMTDDEKDDWLHDHLREWCSSWIETSVNL